MTNLGELLQLLGKSVIHLGCQLSTLTTIQLNLLRIFVNNGVDIAHWLRDFPHINLTPKAHDMIWVLPEVLKRRRTFQMFYKMEERGEAIHAELNQIQRRIWCIRNQENRLWKFIELYELKNQLDTSIIEPIKE